MRCIVLGAGGQLAAELVPRLPGEVVPLPRAAADLTRPAELCATLTSLRPDVIINSAAYNFVDRAEAEPEAAFAVNAWGVRQLAQVCRDLDCLLVHFSSDYVFGLDEERTTPYHEGDAPGPVNVYGLSKLAGEFLVQVYCPRHLILRTCGLYGRHGSGGKGTNFVQTMLRLAREGRPIRVVADQRCTPSYTVDVAAAAVTLLQAGCQGLYHVSNTSSCTWYDFAREVFALAGIEANLAAITSREYSAAARRPRYSVLDTTAATRAGAVLRPWREALAAYLRTCTPYGRN
jgi:dTDP-4-dehydrorhamnose reductase